jgi:hypothetical protein
VQIIRRVENNGSISAAGTTLSGRERLSAVVPAFNSSLVKVTKRPRVPL